MRELEPIDDPVHLQQPKLREFAFQAAWIATVAETDADLDNLLVDLPPDEPLLLDFTTSWPWDVDPMAVARSLVQASRDAAAQKLRTPPRVRLLRDDARRDVRVAGGRLPQRSSVDDDCAVQPS